MDAGGGATRRATVPRRTTTALGRGSEGVVRASERPNVTSRQCRVPSCDVGVVWTSNVDPGGSVVPPSDVRAPHHPSRPAAVDVRSRTREATAPASRLADVPTFKAAYLIHGDDHGRIGE